MRRSPIWPYGMAAVLMVVVFLATQTRFDGDRRPTGGLRALDQLSSRSDLNLLFILVDTLRSDRLGSYGYDRPTSPHLDSLAATGIRFSNHLAQSSWTKTSMASLWTSLYPASSGVLRAADVVSAEAELPAEILRARGLRTVGLWRNGWVAPNFGFGQGFESYVTPRPGRPPRGFRQENPGIRLIGSDFDIVGSVEEFLRTRSDERWFLYAHMMDVHQYATDEESALFGNTYSDVYDNAIHFTDRAIRSLVDLLEERGLRDRTIVVIASDHGEAFGEHGFEGHARDVHAEVTRTPWIISLPFRLSEAVVVDTPSQNVDIWPTLLELMGAPSQPVVDGSSLLPEIRAAMDGGSAGEEPREDGGSRVRVAHIDRHWARSELKPRPLVAVDEGPHRFIYDSGRVALFDIESDPGERVDVAASEPDSATTMRSRIDAYLERVPAWQGGVPQVELDDMQLGQLRALGYVVEE